MMKRLKNDMETGLVHAETVDYLSTMQQIMEYREGTGETSTPYQFETRRQETHQKLFEKWLLPRLHLVEGFTGYDAYQRSKEIFSRLDEVWKMYDTTDFDLTSDYCVEWLAIYLDEKFLYSTETLYYLEGRTQHIHGLSI